MIHACSVPVKHGAWYIYIPFIIGVSSVNIVIYKKLLSRFFIVRHLSSLTLVIPDWYLTAILRLYIITAKSPIMPDTVTKHKASPDTQ